MPDEQADALVAVLASAQRVGLIGPGPLDEAIAHTHRFVDLVPRTAALLIDLGSGGGLPGLVIAVQRPDLDVVLVERRGRAADVLRRSITALGVADRVSVLELDAVDVAHDEAWREHADVVSGRGVAPPPRLAELAMPLLRPGGVLIASTATVGQAWPASLPDALGGGAVTRHDGLIVAQRGASCTPNLPRQHAEPALF